MRRLILCLAAVSRVVLVFRPGRSGQWTRVRLSRSGGVCGSRIRRQTSRKGATIGPGPSLPGRGRAALRVLLSAYFLLTMVPVLLVTASYVFRDPDQLSPSVLSIGSGLHGPYSRHCSRR